jgi:hypothetical protein
VSLDPGEAMEKTAFITTDVLLERLYAAGWRWQLISYGEFWMAMVVRGQQGGAGRAHNPEDAFLAAVRQAFVRAEQSLGGEPPADER